MGNRPTPHLLLLLLACALACILASSCAAGAASAAPKGRLVIIGGALSADNGEIYGRMVELAGDGTIGVVPTASGVPEQSLPSALERIDRHGGEGRAVAIDIRHDQPQEAANPKWAALIDESAGLYFTGGVQTRIVNAFRPDDGDTICHVAAARVLSRGGFIAGTSAGAAMMCDPMIQGGTSRAALAFGVNSEEDENRGMRIGKGMGFFPFGVTDQHFLERGRLGRLVVSLEHTHEARGYGVAENRALDANLATGVLEAIGGPRAVLVADISGMQRQGEAHLGVRLTLMNSGDVMDGATGAFTPGPGLAAIAIPASNAVHRADDAWADHAIPDLMVVLVREGGARAIAMDPAFELILTADDTTRAWAPPGDSDASPTIHSMRLDILPRASVSAEAR